MALPQIDQFISMKPTICRSLAACASLALATVPAVSSEEDVMRPAMIDPQSPNHGAEPASRTKPSPLARRDKLPAAAHTAVGGIMLTQTSSVRTSCFPASLAAVLRDMSSHFGRPVVVTSGYRGGGRSGSYHRKCQAADVQIAGVAPSAIARYARNHGSVGGVGTYGHTRSVHVDVGDRVFSWNGNRRRNAMSSGFGCCPVCAAMSANNTGKSRFEAVCTG